MRAVLPRGGGQTQTPQSDKKQNDCCFSFACTPATRGDQGCICKHTSKYDLALIRSIPRREYVKLLRAFAKANPGKSLKVAIRLEGGHRRVEAGRQAGDRIHDFR